MYLINTRTLKLEYFPSESDIKYAILSHRWEAEEVSFDEMKSLRNARKRKGFFKIKRCCELAKLQGLEYAWADTCCINKDSSAELSEAINSMFRWYQKSTVCFAYLCDVGTEESSEAEEFAHSLWFKRGWTLQELIAPKNMEFYNKFWRKLGTKSQLAHELSVASKVPEDVLKSAEKRFEYSIAQRMHWAAERLTTRIEDRAYSLMGLFNINMPMLYGEGEKAFVRLQEEIIKHSHDQTIFAWKGVPSTGSGLLASSPDNFSDDECAFMSSRPESSRNKPSRRVPYSITNLGISIELTMRPWVPDIYLAFLKSWIYRKWSNYTIGDQVVIFLFRIDGMNFRRVALSDLGDYATEYTMADISPQWKHWKLQTLPIYVQSDFNPFQSGRERRIDKLPHFGLCIKADPNEEITISSSVSDRCTRDSKSGLITLQPDHYGCAATIEFKISPRLKATIHVGFSFDFLPKLVVAMRGWPSNLCLNDVLQQDFEDLGLSGEIVCAPLPSIARGIYICEITPESYWRTSSEGNFALVKTRLRLCPTRTGSQIGWCTIDIDWTKIGWTLHCFVLHEESQLEYPNSELLSNL